MRSPGVWTKRTGILYGYEKVGCIELIGKRTLEGESEAARYAGRYGDML